MTSATTYEHLLRAILEDPLSDDLRLVLADFLEDEGETERSEFIRLQVEKERMNSGCMTVLRKECDGTRADWCLRCRLLNRERELLDAHQFSWLPRALMDIESEVLRDVCTYRRGLVESISLTLTDFMKHAGVIFSAAPILRVSLTDRRPWVAGWHGGDSRPGEPESLPLALWVWLPGVDVARENRWHWYATPDKACTALSDACVLYGRRCANLPSLR